MSVDVLILLATAVLAVVALAAAVIAVRSLREVRQLRAEPAHTVVGDVVLPASPVVEQNAARHPTQVVEGRVIVPVSQEQLVAAELARPAVRAAVVWAGVSHALRPESRRRIAILMRREYRMRRRARLRAGRRAARNTHESSQSESWLSS